MDRKNTTGGDTGIPGARPQPILGAFTQVGINWILVDVEHDILKMPVVSNIPIPVITHPNTLGIRNTKAEFFVLGQSPARCNGFPALDNPRYGRKSFHEDMHMVRHDAPRDESIPLAVKVLERIAHLGRHFWMTECATTHSGIQPLLDPLAALGPAQRLGELGQFFLPALEFFLWQAIRQTTGDCLHQACGIAMG